MARKKADNRLRAGVVLETCCAGFHMQPATARRFGFEGGSFIQAEHPEKDTVIVRELMTCRCVGRGMHKDYIYMDEESARYLNLSVHDELVIAPAQYPMDMP